MEKQQHYIDKVEEMEKKETASDEKLIRNQKKLSNSKSVAQSALTDFESKYNCGITNTYIRINPLIEKYFEKRQNHTNKLDNKQEDFEQYKHLLQQEHIHEWIKEMKEDTGFLKRSLIIEKASHRNIKSIRSFCSSKDKKRYKSADRNKIQSLNYGIDFKKIASKRYATLQNFDIPETKRQQTDGQYVENKLYTFNDEHDYSASEVKEKVFMEYSDAIVDEFNKQNYLDKEKVMKENKDLTNQVSAYFNIKMDEPDQKGNIMLESLDLSLITNEVGGQHAGMEIEGMVGYYSERGSSGTFKKEIL